MHFLPYFFSLIILCQRCQGHDRPGPGSLENKTALTAEVSKNTHTYLETTLRTLFCILAMVLKQKKPKF